MRGFLPLFLGISGIFLFSWVGLTMIPNAQIGGLEPQVNDQDEADIYPLPKSGMAERGREIYTANGCVYCHSQQVRPDYASSDIERKWGERRSAPRDYIFERPALLGKMRMGPDLSNIGKRAPAEDVNAPPPSSTQPVTAAASPAPAPAGGAAAPPAPGAATAAASPAGQPPAPGASPAAATAAITPGGASPAPATAAPTADTAPAPGGAPLLYSAAWHHRHLYAPRSVSFDSTMPAYRFLYEKRKLDGQPSADAVQLTGKHAPPEGYEIVPTYDAKCLVAYLMSLDQSHPLKEVKSTAAAPASPPQPGQAAK